MRKFTDAEIRRLFEISDTIPEPFASQFADYELAAAEAKRDRAAYREWVEGLLAGREVLWVVP